MHLAPAILLSAVVQTAPDTALALHQARELLDEHYSTGRTHLQELECEASDLWECFQGDWSCIDYVCPWDLAETRHHLIRRLEALAPSAGNSEWLFRQRVALAIKRGDVARAAAIADSCSSADSWCLRLRGFPRHRLSPGDGLAHFDSAFALMGEDARCTWSDPRAAAPADLLPAAAGWDCPDDEALHRRFWWLADPLWSQPGNERYLEHLSRRVMSRMTSDVWELDGKAFAPGEGWMWESVRGDEPWNIPIRQGFPNSVRRLYKPCRFDPCHLSGGTTPYVHGGYGFAPDSLLFLHPLRSTMEDWAVEWRRAGCASMWTYRARRKRVHDSQGWLGQEESLEQCGQERYVPRRSWQPLSDYQIAVFRRGPRLLVATAGHVPPTIGPRERLRAALAVGHLDDLSIDATEAPVDALRVLRTRVLVPDSGEHLASLEVVGPGNVGRARFGLPTPALEEGFGLSDVALVRPEVEPDGASIEASLLPFQRVPRERPVGVYAEVYGLVPDEQVEVTLRVGEQGAGLLDRVGRFLGLSSAPEPVETEWQERVPDAAAPTPLFVTLDLQNLSSGRHRLAVTVQRSDGTRVRAEREVVVE